MPGAILSVAAKGGKRLQKRSGTGRRRRSFRQQAKEVVMLKALLTPVLLGLGVAMLIRMTAPRRAY
ncbi:MAG: hypothetical protein JO001_08870 [Alphaproteobacteria bacterium]|nr:hypothetical protein [Alphaproteobacteria bacterium]